MLNTFYPSSSTIKIASQTYDQPVAGTTYDFNKSQTTFSNPDYTFKFTNPSDINQLLGSGTYSLKPYTTVSTSITGNGNFSSGIKTTAGVTLTVEYLGTKTTPVPFEFSSDSVIIPCAGTLIGISLWKRKRQRAQA